LGNFREYGVEEFTKRSSQSNVNDAHRLKRSNHHAVSEGQVADTQRSYLELPAPVLVGALLLGGVLAKNDDDDLTFASLAILFLLYAFHVVGEYVLAQRRRHDSRSDEPDGAESKG
jgi:hypothetical protein